MSKAYKKSTPPYSREIIIFLISVGIFFRFANLGAYPYWGDEFFSLLRMSGYTQAELAGRSFDGKPLLIADLEVYQGGASRSKNILDTVYSLAIEDSQHPPFYYILLRMWVEVFGNSVVAIRSLSVIISLLSLMGVYWLSVELFGSSLVAWISVALFSISPFYLLIAQETREYSLWTVLILLSSAILLYAVRTQDKRSWIAFAISSSASLYAFPLSIFVMGSHFLYIAVKEKFRPTCVLKNCLFCLGFAVLSFLPWLIVMQLHRDQIIATNRWSSYSLAPLELTGNYIFNLTLTFAAIPNAFSKFPNVDIPLVLWVTTSIVVLSTVFISGYALYFLAIKAPKPVKLFLLSLAGFTFVAIFLPDWLFNGRRSTIYRYLIPCYLSLHLSIAYLVAHKLTLIDKAIFWWRGLIAVVFVSAFLTCGIHTQVSGGLNSYREPDHPAIAQAINAVPNRVLIGNVNRAKDGAIGIDGSLGVLFSLLHRLEPSTRVQLVVSPAVPEIPAGRTVFLYNPSEAQLGKIRQKYRTTIIQESKQGSLWKLG